MGATSEQVAPQLPAPCHDQPKNKSLANKCCAVLCCSLCELGCNLGPGRRLDSASLAPNGQAQASGRAAQVQVQGRGVSDADEDALSITFVPSRELDAIVRPMDR